MAQIDHEDTIWRSHWLQQALAIDNDLAPPLESDISADVCIVGGGYLGLWTAIRLKEARPQIDVALIERDICGGGPSGRNSGMLLSAWTKFASLAALAGPEEALRVVKLSSGAIDGLDAFCKANEIDCWFDRVGWLWGATCAAQVGAWSDAVDRLESHGYKPASRVGRDEIVRLSGATGYLAGVYDASAATIHPGFLVRGLRRVALRLGVKIYEKTTMTGFSRSGSPMVRTKHATIRASKLVLAMNAWSAAIPELAPALFIISSDDAVSVPMQDSLDAAGYSHGPLVIDSRVFVSGYRSTRDGRLVVGVTGGHIGYGGVIDSRFDRPSPRIEAMRSALRASHPALADFAVAGSWNGPIDRTDSGLPLFGALPGKPDILYGYGFSGNGIGMSYLGGQILTSILLGKDDGFSACALVRPVNRGFPSEPIRFFGAHFVRGAVRRLDRLEHQDRKAGPLTRWFAGLAPAGVTPSKANIVEKKKT